MTKCPTPNPVPSAQTVIDPPSGWMYGFPTIYDKGPDQTIEEWLVSKGYPQKLIDQGMHKHCRYWEFRPDPVKTTTVHCTKCHHEWQTAYKPGDVQPIDTVIGPVDCTTCDWCGGPGEKIADDPINGPLDEVLKLLDDPEWVRAALKRLEREDR